MYSILKLVGATDVMWLMFWIYVPLGMLIQIMAKIAESTDK
jgi:hypothetical protein